MSGNNKLIMDDLIIQNKLQSKIFTIRGEQVMIDHDLAALYGVETKNLNRAVKRNIDRFPERFRFQLTQEEFDKYREYLRSYFATIENEKSLRFQIGTAKKDDETLNSQTVDATENRGGRRTLPYVFTEQGVSMLSAVLNSETAVQMSIQILNDTELYHIGASLKDLGKKWFAFSKMNISSFELLDKLKTGELL